jgi:hypothetical protein
MNTIFNVMLLPIVKAEFCFHVYVCLLLKVLPLQIPSKHANYMYIHDQIRTLLSIN